MLHLLREDEVAIALAHPPSASTPAGEVLLRVGDRVQLLAAQPDAAVLRVLAVRDGAVTLAAHPRDVAALCERDESTLVLWDSHAPLPSPRPESDLVPAEARRPGVRRPALDE